MCVTVVVVVVFLVERWKLSSFWSRVLKHVFFEIKKEGTKKVMEEPALWRPAVDVRTSN